jgi:hypothetical protein
MTACCCRLTRRRRGERRRRAAEAAGPWRERGPGDWPGARRFNWRSSSTLFGRVPEPQASPGCSSRMVCSYRRNGTSDPSVQGRCARVLRAAGMTGCRDVASESTTISTGYSTERVRSWHGNSTRFVSGRSPRLTLVGEWRRAGHWTVNQRPHRTAATALGGGGVIDLNPQRDAGNDEPRSSPRVCLGSVRHGRPYGSERQARRGNSCSRQRPARNSCTNATRRPAPCSS